MSFKGLRIHSLPIPAAHLHWRKWFTLSFFLIAFFISAAAQAQNNGFRPIILNKTSDGGTIGRHIIVQKDSAKNVTVDKIRQTMGSVLAGKISADDRIHLGLDGASYWLAFKILNQDAQQEWVFDLGRLIEGRNGHIDTFKAYEMPLPYPGAQSRPEFYLKDITADGFKGFNAVTLAPGTQKLIILNIVPIAGLSTTITPQMHPASSIISLLYAQAFSDFFYIALILSSAVFIALMAIRQRKLTTLSFTLYFLVVATAYLHHEHNGTDTDAGFFKLIAVGLSLTQAILALLCIKIFCNINHQRVRERYILYGLGVLSILAAGAAFLVPSTDGLWQTSITQGIPLSVYLVVTLMAYAQAAYHNIHGYHYFFSWMAVLAGFVISLLTAEEILPAMPFTINAIWVSYIPQAILVAIALKTSTRNIETETNIAQKTEASEALNLKKLKQTRDEGDHSRLLRVIEKERELLTDLKQKETARLEEMRLAKEEADEANRAKSAFLAVVSHEIRTPMTGIMGMVRLLLDSNISKQQKDYALTIQESGDAMLGLLNDILDFEKIQRGKMDLENISFDLNRLIHGVVSLMSGHAAQKNVTLSARVDDDLPRFVKGDPTRLRQVLLNLMGNALKFTESGSVTLLIRNLTSTETANHGNEFMIYFAVTDTGIGISEEAQKNLFSPFAQADSTIARKFGGSGLGLAISKGLVEAMGSTVNINSQPGEGSTFFFTLKMERGISSMQDSGKKIQERIDVPKIAPIHILVVDDNTINRKVISSFLLQDDHIVTTSSSAEDALQKIETQDFDLVLMDIELPGLSGNEATKMLRANADVNKAHIPVIALTGNTGKDDMGRYLADGMNDLIPKPIDPDQLKIKIADVVTKSKQREIKTPESALAATAAPSAPNEIQQAPQPIIYPVLSNAPQPIIEPVGAAAMPPAPVQDTEIFNPEMLLSLKNAIGREQLDKLLSELIEKTDEILGGLDLAARAGNMDMLSARAHELKGMAGNFGLVEISEIAASAERKAKTNEKDGLGDLVDSLPGARQRAAQALQQWMAE